jgi:hypothetical protein
MPAFPLNTCLHGALQYGTDTETVSSFSRCIIKKYRNINTLKTTNGCAPECGQFTVDKSPRWNNDVKRFTEVVKAIQAQAGTFDERTNKHDFAVFT